MTQHSNPASPENPALENPALEVPFTHPLAGSYTARIWQVDCELELSLDQTGCLIGTFTADGETLEVFGGVPSLYGEVYGVIREGRNGETLAVFRAVPQVQALLLEIDLPGPNDLMLLAQAESVVFSRSLGLAGSSRE